MTIWRNLLNIIFFSSFIQYSIDDLVTVYTSFVRPLLEYACPVWHCAITKTQQSRIERIQKRSLRMILSYQYHTYAQALALTGLQSLHDRREHLCLMFDRKVFQSPSSGKWFLPANPSRLLRNNRLCLEPRYRTERYRNSSIPFLTRLLNTHGL